VRRALTAENSIWVAAGGTAASAVRAGALGLPMALAIIGGMPERFVSLVNAFRESARRAGHDPAELPLGINSHGYLAETSQRAADEFFPPYASMMNAIGKERGWQPLGRRDFDAMRAPRGALFVGSPQEVVDKILFQHELFGHQRFLAQMSVGTLPHRSVMRAIELLGTEVAPQVRRDQQRHGTAREGRVTMNRQPRHAADCRGEREQEWRRERDSNPRIAALQAAALATSPSRQSFGLPKQKARKA
jgi:hypothetical protein